ncbi:aryl-alcohol oxidase-like protein [Mycena vulgaris]|nr:aryl-alcohol oxidase-like protein [Mycena vulgaris]
MTSPRLLILLSLARLCLGKIFTAPEQITTKHYDFIVVGAGTAGCVVASRLTEDPTVRVLVIEAGGSDNGTNSAVISTPMLAGQGVGTIFDWNYTVTHQAGLNDRAFPFPRGLGMGGSSSINSMIYSRGPSEDFDRLASVSGDAGWAWENLQKYIFWNERHVPAWNNRSNAGQYNPLVHGRGPLLTSLTAIPFELDRRVLQTGADHSDKYPFNLDLNSGDGLGVGVSSASLSLYHRLFKDHPIQGWLHTTVGNSARSSSSSAYLHPALDSRSNLDLLLYTQVTHLTSTGATSSTFTGVQVSQNTDAQQYAFTATKEVILSAGAVGTPQILMLSGVGPKDELEKLGIESVVDLPDVGRNLQDQTILGLQWEANAETLSGFFNDPAAYDAALARYAENKTGFAAANEVVNTLAFLRLPESSPLLLHGDPAAGPHSPHFQFAFLNTFLANWGQATPPTGNYISVAIVVQSPTSRGSLNITSSSAFTYPTIDPAYFTTAFDIGTAVHAVKTLRAFLATSAWDGFLGAPFPAVAALTTDAAIESYVRTWASTLMHPTSTAKISRTTDEGGVVGPDLLVKGAQGVRVVDASILPFAPGGFPQAQVYIIAERAAALIKDTWSLQ